MNRPTLLLFFVFLISAVYGQQERLPADLRQHNLTTYNASLFNPAFSVGRNNPDAVAFWSRWQWQGIDADPSTLFLNYTRSLNERSAAGLGFFQHNTGIFFNTGAALNYARTFVLNERIKLAVG
ncbi:MAG: type IX secretion system membrane protein PorP/SprF, partial [Pricia sp.]